MIDAPYFGVKSEVCTGARASGKVQFADYAEPGDNAAGGWADMSSESENSCADEKLQWPWYGLVM